VARGDISLGEPLLLGGRLEIPYKGPSDITTTGRRKTSSRRDVRLKPSIKVEPTNKTPSSITGVLHKDETGVESSWEKLSVEKSCENPRCTPFDHHCCSPVDKPSNRNPATFCLDW
jgi:hypothetical protein